MPERNIFDELSPASKRKRGAAWTRQQLAKALTSLSSSVQERATKALIAGNRLTLSFSPSVGLNTMTVIPCAVPTVFTFVSYGNLQSVVLRPVGDPLRKKTLAELLSAQMTGSSFVPALLCGSRTSLP